MECNKIYSFSELESFLRQWENQNKCFKVNNVDQKCNALMHTFQENFCGDWKAGDAILFYADGEVHSAEPRDQFLLLEIILI